MTNLNSIELEDNKFDGFFEASTPFQTCITLMQWITTSSLASLPTSLRGLRLDDNNFYEDISRLTFTAEMVALTYISISNNRFLGDLAAAVAPLPNPQTLDASRNQFAGAFPLFKQQPEGHNLHTNLIDGVIPASFAVTLIARSGGSRSRTTIS